MVSTYTASNNFEKPGQYDYPHTWDVVANNAFDMIDASMDGYLAFTLSGSKTLTATSAVASEINNRVLHITSGTGGTVTIEAQEKWYHVVNDATGDVTVTCGVGATATVPMKSRRTVFCTGANTYVFDAPGWATIASDTPAGATSTFTASAGFKEYRFEFDGIRHGAGADRQFQVLLKDGGGSTLLTLALMAVVPTATSEYGYLHIDLTSVQLQSRHYVAVGAGTHTPVFTNSLVNYSAVASFVFEWSASTNFTGGTITMEAR